MSLSLDNQFARAVLDRLLDDLRGVQTRINTTSETDGDVADELALAIGSAIVSIDECMAQQIDRVLSAPAFRRLEASWRSLAFLVDQLPVFGKHDKQLLKMQVLNATVEEIHADLEDAVEFDGSHLFRCIYEHSYGRFGGEPFGVVVVDHAFGCNNKDVTVLTGLAGVGAAAHTMILASAAPELLGCGNWSELAGRPIPPPDTTPAGRSRRWQLLRESDNARYVSLVLPRFLLRRPYDSRRISVRLPYREASTPPVGDARVWGNAAFALASRIAAAAHKHGWPVLFRGLQDGAGIVTDLPQEDYETEAPGRTVRAPIEILVTETQERALVSHGLISLSRVQGSPNVAFYSTPTLHKPLSTRDDRAARNLELSARVHYMLLVSRFAHYFKAMLRDETGGFVTRDDVYHKLAKWVEKWVDLDPKSESAAGLAGSATLPLRGYELDVRERGEGRFRALLKLQPHYQIEDPDVQLRVSVELGA